MTEEEARTIEPLVLDLLTWLASEPKPYAEVMEGWRTSCPRLPVWESALDRQLVERQRCNGVAMVAVSDPGRIALRQSGRLPV